MAKNKKVIVQIHYVRLRRNSDALPKLSYHLKVKAKIEGGYFFVFLKIN